MNNFSIRELGSGERAVVDSVFAGLSPYSRYLRFHSPVADLTPLTRTMLAAVDGSGTSRWPLSPARTTRRRSGSRG